MAPKGYLGPAGIFSTDDPFLDRLNIEAEQYNPEEYEGQPDPDHEDVEEESWPVMIEVVAGSAKCTTHWWAQDTIEDGTFESWKKQTQEKHDKECSCGATLEFDQIP